MSAISIAGRAGWLEDPHLRRVLSVLGEDGEEARIAGGAVRNALLGQPVTDIDIATTTLPEETARRGAAAGFKVVPTGIAHGTVTLVAGGRPYEVTTLRADIETDGRRARVRFGRDWQADAERRDFTINGLFARADGSVVDLVGGIADIEARRVRFIGDPERRIREDYLRILRLFRFFAWYGAGRPDADALRACARLKDGLDDLSAERVWAELRKLMAAPDPARALLWMRQTGVLTRVLPESEKWGIDAIHPLVGAERDLGWTPDPLLRLMSIVPPDAERMAALATRLRLSNVEAGRLTAWANAAAPSPGTTDAELDRQLYFGDPRAAADRLALAVVAARGRAVTDSSALIEAGHLHRQHERAVGWSQPKLPIGGNDLKALGAGDGKALGALLRALEAQWVDSRFALTGDALKARAAAMLAESKDR